MKTPVHNTVPCMHRIRLSPAFCHCPAAMNLVPRTCHQQLVPTMAAASASASAASFSACCRRAATIFAGSASGTVPVWYFFTKRLRRLRVSFWRSLVSFRRFWYSRRRCCQGVSSSAVSLSSLPCRRGPLVNYLDFAAYVGQLSDSGRPSLCCRRPQLSDLKPGNAHKAC